MTKRDGKGGAQRSFELAGIEDLRELDLDTGKRIPLTPGEGAVCDRCGREHAVVWHVRETTPGRERDWQVGSTCGPKILAGWKPEKETVSLARKLDKLRARVRAWTQRLDEAVRYGKTFRTRALPEVEREPSEVFPGRDAIYLQGTNVFIFVPAGSRLTTKEMDKLREEWAQKAALAEGYGWDVSLVVGAVAGGKSVEDVMKMPSSPWGRGLRELEELEEELRGEDNSEEDY